MTYHQGESTYGGKLNREKAYHQGASSYRRTEEGRRFNVGGVCVFNTPPARQDSTLGGGRKHAAVTGRM